MTPNDPATSASHPTFGPLVGGPSAPANCDTLIGRLGQLADADPPLLLQSHPVTRDLAGRPSPVSDPAYKL